MQARDNNDDGLVVRWQLMSCGPHWAFDMLPDVARLRGVSQWFMFTHIITSPPETSLICRLEMESPNGIVALHRLIGIDWITPQYEYISGVQKKNRIHLPYTRVELQDTSPTLGSELVYLMHVMHLER